MLRPAVSLIVNILAFSFAVAIPRGIRFVAATPIGIVAACLLVAIVLTLVGASVGRIPWATSRSRRVIAAAIIGGLAGAVCLIALTRVGGLTVGSRLTLLIGSTLLAAGPVIGELIRPTLERVQRVDLRTVNAAHAAVFAIFLLSGASGLVYEVVWARQLVLVFGNTTQAVSAILTGFFAGLAIGSVVGGRIADRSRRPLRLYATLELGLVVVVLITPFLFRGLHEVYRSGYTSLAENPTLLQLIRYGLAVLALAPATVLMGATLPTLSRHLARNRDELGESFGSLYSANTIGAVVGTLVAGLLLIEIVGLTLTLVCGAIGSAIAGLAALALDRRDRRLADRDVASVASDATVRPEVASHGPADTGLRRIAIVLAFVSGATSLGYQLLWTRLLASGSGNTTYVFTLILAVFLVGIAVGAAIIARQLRVRTAAIATLGAIQVFIAALVLMGMVLLSGQLPAISFVYRVLLVVLPTTLVIGATLPLASSLVGTGAKQIGRDAGLLLGANTLGAIGGTFVVPFLLIPTIGSLRSVALLALVNVLTGVVLLFRTRDLRASTRKAVGTLGVGVAVVVVLGLALPNPLVIDPGATRLNRSGGLLATAEDEIAAVQASRTANVPHLLVGGTGMTRLSVDTKLMAYLPLMTRPDAQRMLVIALGMGSTYRAALRAGMTVDGVELVPSVPGMFRWFYNDANAVLADPHGRLSITDGRNFVELRNTVYDLVAVDPPPPIESSGTSILYSREFYEATAHRLTDNGVMMEWMPTGQSVDEFRSHVGTFKSVFPNVILAFSPHHLGVYMLGSRQPISLDRTTVQAVLDRPTILADLLDTADNEFVTSTAWADAVERLPWISGQQVDVFSAGAPLILDDRPVTEYFLLRRLFGPKSPLMTESNLRAAMPPG